MFHPRDVFVQTKYKESDRPTVEGEKDRHSTSLEVPREDFKVSSERGQTRPTLLARRGFGNGEVRTSMNCQVLIMSIEKISFAQVQQARMLAPTRKLPELEWKFGGCDVGEKAGQ